MGSVGAKAGVWSRLRRKREQRRATRAERAHRLETERSREREGGGDALTEKLTGGEGAAGGLSSFNSGGSGF